MIKSFFLYFFSFAISIFFFSNYLKSKSIFVKVFNFFICIIVPIIISSFRYGVGIDFFNYMESFYYIPGHCTSIASILSYYQEPFHVLLNLIAYYLFGDFKGYLFLSTLLFLVFSIKGILKYKDCSFPVLSYFIFLLVFYSLLFNGTRQVMAASIIFFAYDYIYERKFFKYLFFVILASLFHKSATVCILLYFIWYDKGVHNKKYYFFIFLITLFIPFISSLIYKICSILGIYGIYFSQYSVNKTFGFILYILPILCLFLLKKRRHLEMLSDVDLKIKFFLRIYIIQLPFQLLGNYVAFADRISLFFLPSQIVLFSIYAYSFKKNKVFVILIIILWYAFYYIIMFVLLKSNGVYPYIYKF